LPRTMTCVQVEDLYDEVLSNAFHLSQDARRLLEAGLTGHARALAVLALEECGKAIMMHEAKLASFRRRDADPLLDGTFWRHWKTHWPKLRAVRDFIIREEYWFGVESPVVDELLLGDVDEYLAELDRWAAQGDSSKLHGLYVDVDPATGRVITPAAQNGASEVAELLEIAHQVGWQTLLGDHIQFVAAPRDDASIPPDNLYTAYADGGTRCLSRSGSRGWEAQKVQLERLSAEFVAPSVGD
jgi:AbiV family abortive infection protein